MICIAPILMYLGVLIFIKEPTFFLMYLVMCFFFFIGSKRKCICQSVPSCRLTLQISVISCTEQTEVRSQELSLGLACRWQWCNPLGHHLLPLRICMSSGKNKSGAGIHVHSYVGCSIPSSDVATTVSAYSKTIDFSRLLLECIFF